MLTRRIDSDKAFLWSNSGSTECILRYDVTRPEAGSAVTVYLLPKFNYLLDRGKLEEIILRYCDFITVPIKINDGEPVNAIYAPWDKRYNSAEQEFDSYEAFVNRRFPDMSMDVFPVKIDTKAAGKPVQARGVLYISNLHLAGLNSTGVVDIFVRKMLVKEGDTTLLPTWAKFVRGVIDSPDLRPTAGRDNVNQEDPAFHAIQDALGDVIVARLAYLAENRPDKFAYINDWHHDHLKGMAMVNSEQFGGSKSIVLQWEGLFQSHIGNNRVALNYAQEALVCDVEFSMPSYNNCYYYRALVERYCENNLMPEAWQILREWRIRGSTEFDKTKSWQFCAEAQLLYVDGKLSAAWDAIRCCQAEEQYLRIHGVEGIKTLTWLIRIAVDAKRLEEARESLLLLFHFHNSESLYEQYDCFHWFAYYYAALWQYLRRGGISASRYDTLEIVQKRAERWYGRAERVGLELDRLLETDVKRKELDALREKL